jgi:hypothetical protein
MTIVTIRSWVKLAKNAMARRDFSVAYYNQVRDISLNVTTGNNIINPKLFKKYRRWDISILMLSISIKS